MIPADSVNRYQFQYSKLVRLTGCHSPGPVMFFRSAFIGLGLFVLLCGVTFFLTDRVLLDMAPGFAESLPIWDAVSTPAEGGLREISLPAWAPFALMAVGCLTVLYSLPLRSKQS
ncbi:MAG: hypothetical protein CMJ47_03310 [Planctomyces sp.]|nr:hypothetical protein [Planctomyces sp.]